MNLGRERLVRLLREAVLTVGAVLGGLVLVVGVASLVFDVRPLVFRSGSMSPTIETGALAIAHEVDAADLEVGDIVSVHTASGSRVTHRIVLVDMDGDDALLRLKGDANEAEDAETYRVAEADVVVFHVPAAGYALQWASGSTGRFALGLYAAFLVLVIFQRTQGRSSSAAGGHRRREDDEAGAAEEADLVVDCRGRLRVSTAVGVVVAAALSLVVGLHISPTWAAWTNAGALTGTSVTSYQVPAPVLSNCVIGGSGSNRTATFNWTGVTSPATTYQGALSGALAGSGVIGGTASAPTYVVSFSTASGGSGNRGKSGTVTITPRLTAAASWTGPTDTGTINVASNGNPTCST